MIGEAASSVKQAADTVKDMTEALYDVMRNVAKPLWDHTKTNTMLGTRMSFLVASSLATLY